jgi:integrase
VVGLRWGAVELRTRTLAVRISRSRGEDNAPKTQNSDRTLTLPPDVVAVLRAAQPLHVTPDTFVFTTPTGLPLDTDRFVELRWHRALRATGTRPRKFYATRHTFISVALSRGCMPKWVAKYCGTSLEMLDKHYGHWMEDDQEQLDLLAPRGATVGRRGAKPGPKRIAAASTRSGKRRGEIRTRTATSDDDPRRCAESLAPQGFRTFSGVRLGTPKRP